MQKLEKNELHFVIKGDIESIEAKSLAATLTNLDTLFREATNEIAINTPITLAVKAHEKGSFSILLQLLPDTSLLQQAVKYLNPTSLDLAVQVLDIATKTWELKKHLLGKKPKEVKDLGNGQFQVTNSDNVKQNFTQPTVNLGSNNVFDNCTIQVFQNVQDISGAKGVQVANSEKPLFEVSQNDKKEFKTMTSQSGLINDDKPKQEIPVADAILTYHDSTVDENKKWNVTYQGNKLPVTFHDPKFIEDWQSGKVIFGVGYRLRADVNLRQEWNEAVSSFLTKSIIVMEVKEIIPNEYQTGLAL
jgi:hypothetical protein